MFKRTMTLIIASLLSSAAILSAQETTDTITLGLDDCIKIALDKNPTIKVANMEIQRVEYSKREIIGQLLPSLNFGANYSRTIEKQTAYFNMKDMPGMGGGSESGSDSENSTSESEDKQDEGIKMGLDNSYQIGIDMSLPIIAPQIWQSISLSKAQVLQNIEKARSSKLSLINEIEHAYYALLLANDSYKVVKQNHETAIFNAKIVNGKFKAGTASEYEALRANVQVKNIEPELLQSEIAIKQSLLQLKVLMDIDIATNIKAKDQLSDYESSMYEKAMSFDTSLQWNTDLRSLDLQTDYLKKALKVQQMSWFPTVALTANYYWTSMTMGAPFKNIRWNPYSSIGFSLSFPIFQGGQRYNRIKQADISVREMGFQRENLEQSLKMQVELQMDNINKNVKQISTSAAGVEEADKAFSIMQKSFQIGAATYIDLRDAEYAQTQAKLAYYQSIYNYLIATSDLDLLLGSHDKNNQ